MNRNDIMNLSLNTPVSYAAFKNLHFVGKDERHVHLKDSTGDVKKIYIELFEKYGSLHYPSVHTLYLSISRTLSALPADDKRREMPMYDDNSEEQGYLEHYLNFDHDDYVALININVNADDKTITLRYTTDDEDNGNRSSAVFNDDEIDLILAHIQQLVAVYDRQLQTDNCGKHQWLIHAEPSDL
jgi:hypothetical protein